MPLSHAMSALDVPMPMDEPWFRLKYAAVTRPRRHIVPPETGVSLCGIDSSRRWVKAFGDEPRCGTCERLFDKAVQAAIMDDGDEEP